MASLNISTGDLPPEIARVFQSMLKVVDGRSIASWSTSGVEQADVLVTHAGGNAEIIDDWGRSGKPIVMVLDDSHSWAPTPFTLRHPFRIMQLLNLLDQVAEATNTKTMKPPDRRSSAIDASWSAIAMLQQTLASLCERSQYRLVTQAGRTCWISKGQIHALPDTWSTLQAGPVHWMTFESTKELPPPDAVAMSVSDAGWLFGMSAPAGLAPWLQRDDSYGLRRWPDFGRLARNGGMMAMCALLANRACTVAELARKGEQPLVEAERLLTALSLAGLLNTVTHDATPLAAASPSPTPAGKPAWMRLVGELRRHLGMGA
ncbi:MAG TPA: hypothetical protein VFN29_08070 [Chiayiivirga sp.]|nr:hypothetical protein [Chiayiivirga sp.]